MAKFIITLQASLRPFAFASALTLLAVPQAYAKPRSECNQLTDQAQCAALKSGNVDLCKWIDQSNSYTVKGQRKSYCRTSTVTISKADYERIEAAKAGSSGPIANAR